MFDVDVAIFFFFIIIINKDTFSDDRIYFSEFLSLKYSLNLVDILS